MVPSGSQQIWCPPLTLNLRYTVHSPCASLLMWCYPPSYSLRHSNPHYQSIYPGLHQSRNSTQQQALHRRHSANFDTYPPPLVHNRVVQRYNMMSNVPHLAAPQRLSAQPCSIPPMFAPSPTLNHDPPNLRHCLLSLPHLLCASLMVLQSSLTDCASPPPHALRFYPLRRSSRRLPLSIPPRQSSIVLTVMLLHTTNRNL